MKHDHYEKYSRKRVIMITTNIKGFNFALAYLYSQENKYKSNYVHTKHNL